MRNRNRLSRRGVAAVELGFVTMLFVVPMVIALWEVGRLIHVQQVVSNSAREGARLAAQGYTITTNGTTVQIKRDTGSPNVRDVVFDYLRASGFTTLTTSDVTVEFKFLPESGFNDGLTEPYQGIKTQPFKVTVTIPWNKVRWINMGIIRPETITFTVYWRMMIDEAFSINETLPEW